MITEITVLNRSKIQRITHRIQRHADHESQDYAAIAIHDIQKNRPAIRSSKRLQPKNICIRTFDDCVIAADGYIPIGKQDATLISIFLKRLQSEPTNYHLLVSCEEGISRSTAIASAARDAFKIPEEHIHFGEFVHPNPLVYDSVTQMLQA